MLSCVTQLNREIRHLTTCAIYLLLPLWIGKLGIIGDLVLESTLSGQILVFTVCVIVGFASLRVELHQPSLFFIYKP
jgi:hypothetical protein